MKRKAWADGGKAAASGAIAAGADGVAAASGRAAIGAPLTG